MFINFTNHPSNSWGKEQLETALDYGRIIDIPFPNVNPNASPADIQKEAKMYAERIEKEAPQFVLCQGEFCMAYQVITLLKEKGIKVGAACSERLVTEKQGKSGMEKTSVFHFVQFREY